MEDHDAPRTPLSPWLRWGILVLGLVLPLVPPILGAMIAAASGGRPLVGALLGAVATFLLLGCMWIALGVFGARRELQVWRTSRGRE